MISDKYTTTDNNQGTTTANIRGPQQQTTTADNRGRLLANARGSLGLPAPIVATAPRVPPCSATPPLGAPTRQQPTPPRPFLNNPAPIPQQSLARLPTSPRPITTPPRCVVVAPARCRSRLAALSRGYRRDSALLSSVLGFASARGAQEEKKQLK